MHSFPLECVLFLFCETKGLELHPNVKKLDPVVSIREVSLHLSHYVIYSDPVWKEIFVLFCFYFTYMYYLASVY